MKNPVFYRDLYSHLILNKVSRKAQVQVNQPSIPRVIHYCWFGANSPTDLMKRCLDSWRKYCPDYELKLWNEENFPLSQYPFARQALKDGKWAYVSDVARLHALYYEGGIYMDTDVEVLQPIDRLLAENVFFGYEDRGCISTSTIGARAGHAYIELLLKWYIKRRYGKGYYRIPNVLIISKITRLHYKVMLHGTEFVLPGEVHFYPQEYFSPREFITPNSYCIHHFAGSWLNR